jgi:hypothetical protein
MRLWLVSSLLVAAACRPAGTVVIRGSVHAPNAKLTRDTALVPVTNANVLLCSASDAGVVASKPIATGHTDGKGNYSIDAPPGTQLSSALIVQASASDTCTPVNVQSPARAQSGAILNCPAVQATLDIDVGSEVVTRAIYRYASERGGGLANFTVGEVSGLLAVAQAQAATTGSVADAVQGVDAQVGPALDAALPVLADVGEAAATATVGGSYHFYGIFLENGATQMQRAVQMGSVTVDADAGTFTVQQSEQRRTLSTPCNAMCGASMLSSAQKNDTVSGALHTAGAEIFLSAAQPTVVGQVDRTATLVALPFLSRDGELGLGLLLKQATAAPAIAGDYAVYSFTSTLQASQGGLLSSVARTHLTTQPANFYGATIAVDAGPQDDMLLNFTTCSTSSGITLPQQAGLTQGSLNAAFTIDAGGNYAMQGMNGAVNGFVSADAQLAVFNSGGDTGFSIGVQKPTQAPSIAGRYGFVLVGEAAATNASYTAELITGTLTIGTEADIVYSQTQVARTDACNATCATASGATTTGAQHGTFKLANNGAATFTFGTGAQVFTIDATFSADAGLAVLSHRLEAVTDADHLKSERMIGVALRQ